MGRESNQQQPNSTLTGFRICGTIPESAIDLVFSEFLLRERSGLNPVIDEYIDRFPQYAEELLRQDAFHRALA